MFKVLIHEKMSDIMIWYEGFSNGNWNGGVIVSNGRICEWVYNRSSSLVVIMVHDQLPPRSQSISTIHDNDPPSWSTISCLHNHHPPSRCLIRAPPSWSMVHDHNHHTHLLSDHPLTCNISQHKVYVQTNRTLHLVIIFNVSKATKYAQFSSAERIEWCGHENIQSWVWIVTQSEYEDSIESWKIKCV